MAGTVQLSGRSMTRERGVGQSERERERGGREGEERDIVQILYN